MSISYRYAVLSFCYDLTDPAARSIPVALVGVGETAAGEGFWFYVTRSRPGDALGITGDPVSRKLLNEAPTLFEQQILTGIQEIGAEKFMSWLHERYRGSLHVSAIDERTESAQWDELPSELMRRYQAEVGRTEGSRPLPRPSVPNMRLGPVPRAEACA